MCAFSAFSKIFGATFEKYKFCDATEHDREICLNPAVAILRRTSHCAVTARFLPPFFLAVHNTPLHNQEYAENKVDGQTLTEEKYLDLLLSPST